MDDRELTEEEKEIIQKHMGKFFAYLSGPASDAVQPLVDEIEDLLKIPQDPKRRNWFGFLKLRDVFRSRRINKQLKVEIRKMNDELERCGELMADEIASLNSV